MKADYYYRRYLDAEKTSEKSQEKTDRMLKSLHEDLKKELAFIDAKDYFDFTHDEYNAVDWKMIERFSAHYKSLLPYLKEYSDNKESAEKRINTYKYLQKESSIVVSVLSALVERYMVKFDNCSDETKEKLVQLRDNPTLFSNGSLLELLMRLHDEGAISDDFGAIGELNEIKKHYRENPDDNFSIWITNGYEVFLRLKDKPYMQLMIELKKDNAESDADFAEMMKMVLLYNVVVYTAHCMDVVLEKKDFVSLKLSNDLEFSPSLIKIFNYNTEHLKKFINIVKTDNLSGAKICDHVWVLYEMGVVDKENCRKPLHDELEKLGFEVKTVSSWNDSLNVRGSWTVNGMKQSQREEIEKLYKLA